MWNVLIIVWYRTNFLKNANFSLLLFKYFQEIKSDLELGLPRVCLFHETTQCLLRNNMLKEARKTTDQLMSLSNKSKDLMRFCLQHIQRIEGATGWKSINGNTVWMLLYFVVIYFDVDYIDPHNIQSCRPCVSLDAASTKITIVLALQLVAPFSQKKISHGHRKN